MKKKLEKKYYFLRKKFYKKKKNIIGIIIFFIVFFYTIALVFVLYLLYLKLISPLPEIKSLKSIQIPKASIIYDKNGQELYKIYSENRIYVSYDYISSNMINAIVAGEDKRFWENPGYDIYGIIRAIINGLKNGGKFEGTSGITQQLAKNIFLTNKRSLERKIKELYLAIDMTNKFQKKDILELYLNKVFFGGNSYGVEQASKTFFGVNAKNLNILQSSILASLPKAPTKLSPYTNKKGLLGFLEIIEKDNNEKIDILTKEQYKQYEKLINLYKNNFNKLVLKKVGNNLQICLGNIKNIKFNPFVLNKNNCLIIEYNKLNSFINSFVYEDKAYKIKFNTGRKDYILSRMLEDGYITEKEYKKAILDSIGFEFLKYKDKIKYPYFVMYVKKYLAEKYGEDFLKTGGLKIFTTLDGKLQDKAQEILENQVGKNSKEFNARNAAIMVVENHSGNILVFIGGKDYFDKKNGGNNNMLLARLQPGSIFKPFIYLLAMIKNDFHKDTIITDNKIVFPGGYRPHNFDGQYLGRMTFTKALNFSRNIPAVKLYYAAGEENEIIKFLEKFGMYNLRKFKEDYFKKYHIKYVYSAPMALGTVQVSPFELVQAYQVLANSGKKIELNPILKIIDGNNKLIYDYKVKEKQIIDKKWAEEITNMLADSSKRPKDWNYFLTIKGLKISAKTGTSTKQYLAKKWSKDKEGRLYKKRIIIAKNLWTVAYTKDITVLVWAGNTSGEGLGKKAYGLSGAAPIMKNFIQYYYFGKN